VFGAIVLALACSRTGSGFGSTISQIELLPGNTPGQTIDAGVVSAILSTPNPTNGVTLTRWIFLVDDGTGSMDIFANNPLPSGYTPTLGDKLMITGRNNPFSGIPEMDTLTAISKISAGNTVPNPLVKTIPDLAGYTVGPPAGTAYPDFAGHM